MVLYRVLSWESTRTPEEGHFLGLGHMSKKTFFPPVITGGFALFAMFFGSGNLIFPLSLGISNPQNGLAVTMGLGLTGILMPLVGVVCMALYKGIQGFMAPMGASLSLLVQMILLLLLGPLLVCPRCVIVSYGSFKTLAPDLSPFLFAGGMCFISWALSYKKGMIVPLLGRYLTPCIMVLLGCLMVIGLWKSWDTGSQVFHGFQKHAFLEGITTGYHTMDLLAGFFFSTSLIRYLQKKTAEKAFPLSFQKAFLGATCVGFGLLALVYTGFVFLGATYHDLLKTCSKDTILLKLSYYLWGPELALLMAIMIFFACMTTMMALLSLCGDFIQRHFLSFLKRHVILFMLYTGTFFFALMDMERLFLYASKILNILYPALIFWTFFRLIVFLRLLKRSRSQRR